MKKRIKRVSAMLAMVMALTAFNSVAVFADEQPVTSSTAVVNEAPVPAPAPVKETSNPTDSTSNSTPEQPTPPPTNAPAPATIAFYTVERVDGQDNFWNWHERFNVTLQLHDPDSKIVNVRLLNDTTFTGDNHGATEFAPGGVDESGYRSVTIPNIMYHGGGNVLNIQLSTTEGIQNDQVSVAQCLDMDPNPPAPVESPTPEPVPTEKPEYDYPKILVKDFSFGGTSVEAGKEFVLDLTLFTTSGNANLQDVMVGLNFGEVKGVTLASGSMNTYVGEMAPNTTRNISFKMATDATIEPGAISISVNLTSKNGEAQASPISIPVIQPERFDITNMEAPETMMMGEEGYLSVTFVNKGKSAINNLSAEIQGENIANPGQSQFLGNIAPGTENSVDFNVMPAEEGAIKGKVILSYEDAKGEVKTLEKEFSCTVEPAPAMDDTMGGMDGMMDETMNNEVQSGMPIWGWVLIVVGVVAVVAVVVVVVLKKKQKAKKLAQLEDEDEDEAI